MLLLLLHLLLCIVPTYRPGRLCRVLSPLLLRFWGGVLMLAFAFRVGFPETGWNAVGLIGIVPILTSFAAACPAYRIIGLNTRPTKNR